MNSHSHIAPPSAPLKTSGFPSVLSRLSEASRATALILSLLALWVFAALIMIAVYPDVGEQSKDAIGQYLSNFISNNLLFFNALGLFYLIKFMRDLKGKSAIGVIKAGLKDNPKAVPVTFLRFAIGFASFLLLTYAYSMIKTRIPEIAPYSWDARFMAWDRALFFGRDPWTVFAGLYDMPAVINIMDFFYDFWALLLVGIWTTCFVITKPSAAARFRFPLAIIIAWFVGGNLLAIVFSSAGPCYYGAVTGLPDPYADQMVILSAISDEWSLGATIYQQMLWDVYQSPGLGMGGISAMPSMHCTTAFLFVLLAWKHKIMRVVAIAFFAIILLASVVLAWHYLVDGLLAVPIAAAAWWAAGHILARITINTPA